jgi:hypothetical protein
MARLGIAEGTAGASAMDQPQNIVEELKHWPDDRLDQALETAIYSENSPMPTEGPLAPGYLVLAEKSRRNDIRAREPGGSEAPPQTTVAEEMLASSQGMGPGMGGPQMDPNMMPQQGMPQGMSPQGMPQEDPMQFLTSLQGGPQGVPPGMPPQGMPMGPMMVNTGGLIRRYANGGRVPPPQGFSQSSWSPRDELIEVRKEILRRQALLQQPMDPSSREKVGNEISELQLREEFVKGEVQSRESEGLALARSMYGEKAPVDRFTVRGINSPRVNTTSVSDLSDADVRMLSEYGPREDDERVRGGFIEGSPDYRGLSQTEAARRESLYSALPELRPEPPQGATGMGVLREPPSDAWMEQESPGSTGLRSIPGYEDLQTMLDRPVTEVPMRAGPRPEAGQVPAAEPEMTYEDFYTNAPVSTVGISQGLPQGQGQGQGAAGIAAAAPPSFQERYDRALSGFSDSTQMDEINALRAELSAQNQGQLNRYKDAGRLAFVGGLLSPGSRGWNIGEALRRSAPFVERAEQLSSENNRRVMLDQLAALESGAQADQRRRAMALDQATAESNEAYRAATLEESRQKRASDDAYREKDFELRAKKEERLERSAFAAAKTAEQQFNKTHDLGKKRFSLAEQEVALQAFQFDANLTRQYQSMDREQKEAIYKEAVGVAKANTQSIL